MTGGGETGDRPFRLLIAYATTDGQTRKIAEHCADRLRHGALLVDVGPVAGAGRPDPGAFDAILLLGSVHFDRLQRPLLEFVENHADVLTTRPTLMAVVSMTAATGTSDDLAALEARLSKGFAQAGWTPARLLHVGGAIRLGSYGFLRRWLVRAEAARRSIALDSSGVAELTDWKALDAAIDGWLATVVHRAV